MSWQETCWVWSCVLVGFAPLEALWSDAVSRERAAARGEAASNDDRLISQPSLVVCKHACMERHILGAQVWLLVRLSMNPAQGLKIPEVIVVWQLLWQRHVAVSAHLWH